VRYRKNLKSIRKSQDGMALCTRLFVLGSGEGATQVDLEDVTVTDETATKSADATYGYLTLGGLYSAYKGFTADGDALPAHITVWEYPGPNDVTANWLQNTDQKLKALLANYDPTKTYTLNYDHAAYIKSAAGVASYNVISRAVANKELSNPAALLAWARVLFAKVCVPPTTYEVDLVNLEEKLTFERLALGNTLHVIDEDLGIDVDVTVSRLYWRDFRRLDELQVTLANRAKDIVDYFASLQGTEHAFNYVEQ
jgi:hypothetical protein